MEEGFVCSSFIFLDMIHLLPNTALQIVYLTLKEAVRDLSAFTNYLVEFENCTSREKYYLVADVTAENERYTKLSIGTDTDDAINGSIEINETGQFWYRVFGQNSTTNLDPSDASVVGAVEDGVLLVETQETFYLQQGAIEVPNKVYYQ